METLGKEIFQDIINVYNETLKNDDKLRQLRIVAEKLLGGLMKNYSEKVYGLNARACFILDKHPDAKREEDHFFGFIRLANRAAHTMPLDAKDGEVASCIKVLSAITSIFTKVEAPHTVKDIYEEKELPDLRRAWFANKSHVPEVHAIITSVGEKKQYSNGSGYVDLYCTSEEIGKFSLRINSVPKRPGFENTPASLYDWARSIPDFTRVYIFDPVRNLERPDELSVDFSKTRIVLEPDFLMEAKDTGSIFSQSSREPVVYIVSKLMPVETSMAIFKGNLVNGFLDELLIDPGKDPEVIFDKLVEQNLLTSFAMKGELENIKASILSEHVPVIKENMARLKGEEGKYDVFTEPTFYSEKYGITGRLDILQISKEEPDRKNVIELKSGKKNNSGVWKKEEMQVTAYNLLLRSTFGNDRLGDSSLFYSKHAKEPFQNVPVMTSKEIDFINGRNEAYLMLTLLRNNDDRLYEKILKFDETKLHEIFQKKISFFKTNFIKSSPVAQKYYRLCISFLVNELFESKMSASDSEGSDSSFAALWRQHPSVKEESFYSLIRELTFEKYDPESGVYTFKRNNPKVSRFREGDIIILYPYATMLEPLRRQIMKGSIEILTNETVSVKLYNKQLDHAVFTREKYFAIEQDFRDSNVMNTATSMFSFLTAEQAKKDLILGLREPEFDEINSDPMPGLEPSQNENVAKAIAAKDYFLLQGPPGTGKTSKALMTMVTRILAETDQKITILAFTNKAIKDVNKKLNESGIDYLFNSAGTDDPNSLRSLVKLRDLNNFEERTSRIRVLTSTAASFINNRKELTFFKFHTVIVDEASQLLEPQLSGILVDFDRFILIGDQNQLPAVTVQSNGNTEVQDQDLKNQGLTDMKVSLFERLFNRAVERGWTHAYGTLTEQFRMDESIMQMINHYYHGRLRRAARDPRPLAELYPAGTGPVIEEVLLKSRLIFIETHLSKTGKKNEDEATIASMLVKTMRESGLTSPHDIGVITPWRAQIAAIRQKLEEIDAIDVPVDTVERFQGSENRVIIYSTAVSSQFQLERLGSIGMNRSSEAEVEVDRKLNVVISRAQEQIIVLGSVPVLKISPHYRRLIETIREKGLYINTADRKRIFGT